MGMYDEIVLEFDLDGYEKGTVFQTKSLDSTSRRFTVDEYDYLVDENREAINYSGIIRFYTDDSIWLAFVVRGCVTFIEKVV